MAQSQQDLLSRAEEVKDALAELERSAEAAGLNDPAWQARLEEIRDQLSRALTPELRQRLAELSQAVKDLDPERTRDALARLTEAQEKLRDALERSRELFRRAALEGELANLSSEAKELTEAQRQWTEAVPLLDSTRAAAEEQALASRADSLGSALERLSPDLGKESASAEDRLRQSASQAAKAGQQMAQASRSAKGGRRQEAKRQGEQALRSLEPLDAALREQRQALQEQWKQEVMDALDRALAEASRLAERQLGVSDQLDRGESGPALRGEEAALEEGVEKLLDQVKEVSGKNALVSEQSSVALAMAQDRMRRAREALASPAPNSREAGARAGEAVDALNAAATPCCGAAAR